MQRFREYTSVYKTFYPSLFAAISYTGEEALLSISSPLFFSVAAEAPR